MSTKTVEVDGISYYTLLEGPNTHSNNDPPILLCHALMANLHMWDSTVVALNKAGYTTLRFDHVGHNNSPPPQDSYAAFHMDDITRHMYQLVRAATGQSKTTAVIGCSIGGVLALRYAMLYPDDCGKIISIAAPGISAPEAARELWSERIKVFQQDVKQGSEILCQKTVERWFPGSRQRDADVREKALVLVRTCTLTGYKILADTIRGYDYGEDVERGMVKARCLVVAGSEDGAASPDGLRELSGRIGERSAFVCMDGAGHLPPMHLAEEFEELMLSFLRKEEGALCGL